MLFGKVLQAEAGTSARPGGRRPSGATQSANPSKADTHPHEISAEIAIGTGRVVTSCSIRRFAGGSAEPVE